MEDNQLIENTPKPRTITSLTQDLKKVNIKSDSIILVHSSLSSIGWICGGSVAVIKALMNVIDKDKGTIVMPAFPSDHSDPSGWNNPPVPESWYNTIKEEMPPFEPEITPARGLGRIPELFRNWPGVLRSDHPSMSFAAWGKMAERIVKDHEIEYSLGENSPLADLYDLEANVLMIGVGYENNTSFHLGEYRSGTAEVTIEGAPVKRKGENIWKE